MKKELLINTYENNILLFKENLIGNYLNNTLEYSNEVDSFLIDLNKKIFIKENLESILKITSNKSYITIKEINKTFDLEVINYKLTNTKNSITFEYLLESKENPLKIEIEMSDINEP